MTAFRCMLVAFLLSAPSIALAQTCSWTVPNVNFGSVYTLSGADTDVTAQVSINCSGFTNLILLGNLVRLCPNIGAGSAGATASARQMDHSGNPAEELNYQFYDQSPPTVWGSNYSWANAAGPPTLTLMLNLSGAGSLTRTLYGRVFGGQSTALPGSYMSTFSGTDAQLRYQQCSSLLTCPACSTSLSRSSNTIFTASATVADNCLISATNLNFGTEGLLNANVDATNTISITCTRGTAWMASLNAGSSAGGTVASRRMTGPNAATIGYTIYRNAARTEVWGNGTLGTSTVTGTGSGIGEGATGYGRVPPQSTPRSGTYTDTVILTVTY
jgi:spore coat protein U-like protein